MERQNNQPTFNSSIPQGWLSMDKLDWLIIAQDGTDTLFWESQGR